MLRKTGFLILPLLGLLLVQAHAAKYAGEFMAVGLGARALGFGGSFVSIADDGFACYWNPAGTVGGAHQATLAHSSNFDGLVSYDALGYSRPMSGAGAGLAYLRLSVKDIPYTGQALIDLNGNGRMDPGERLDYTKITSGSDAEQALLLNYGRAYSAAVSWGANLKIVNKSVGRNSAWGAGLDLGALFLLSRRFRLGVNLQDITTTYLAWNTGHKEVITPTCRLGVSWHPLIYDDTPLALAGGADVRFEGRRSASDFNLGGMSADWHLGAEFWLRRRLAFRAGVDQGRPAAGAGLRLGRLNFDYAYLGHAELGSSTRLSGSYTF